MIDFEDIDIEMYIEELKDITELLPELPPRLLFALGISIISNSAAVLDSISKEDFILICDRTYDNVRRKI